MTEHFISVDWTTFHTTDLVYDDETGEFLVSGDTKEHEFDALVDFDGDCPPIDQNELLDVVIWECS